MSSPDDISSEEESQAVEETEQVRQLPITELHPFGGHPFRVVDDETMWRMVESISKSGVITPILARPDPDGGYEIISEHRRCHAAELAGFQTLPVIVREISKSSKTDKNNAHRRKENFFDGRFFIDYDIIQMYLVSGKRCILCSCTELHPLKIVLASTKLKMIFADSQICTRIGTVVAGHAHLVAFSFDGKCLLAHRRWC